MIDFAKEPGHSDEFLTQMADLVARLCWKVDDLDTSRRLILDNLRLVDRKAREDCAAIAAIPAPTASDAPRPE